ncbi:MAG: hypothetical protein IJY07_05155 [Clostridia bacterium]|nr:hypothetical protein [Clostridia bacterium]
MNTRKRLFTLGVIFLIMALVVFAINYYVFHYVTDDGLTLTWHEEAGKPFVTDLIGQLGTLLTFGSISSFLVGGVVFKNDKKK